MRARGHRRSIATSVRIVYLDAEAYDEFSKMMTPMCRFVKPMLSMVPPDPTTLNPKDPQATPLPAAAFPRTFLLTSATLSSSS